MLAIFRDVLGVSSLGPDEDFFERGGQSLQTLQVANRVGLLLKREVPVGTVFDDPTARTLAVRLSHQARHRVQTKRPTSSS